MSKRSRPVLSAGIEALETRQLLSASVKTLTATAIKTTKAVTSIGSKPYRPVSDARPTVVGKAPANRTGLKRTTAYTNYVLTAGPGSTVKPAASATPVGLTPSQLRRFYAIDSIAFGGVTGDGSGQTIAIVDAYDDPYIVSSSASNYSTSDLYQFNKQFGLTQFGSGGPTFTKVNQTGGTTYPTADAGWAGEISLDVEWAHVVAPKANIVLVEANDPYTYTYGNGTLASDTLLTAAEYAASIPGVSAVSMSYGGGEASYETQEDSGYTTPSGHTGVTFLAATGDTGSPGGYPAYSPNVVAVGGTVITGVYQDYSYYSETGWSGSGGGISTYEAQPSYQKGVVTQSTTMRTEPDVSMIAGTGVAVYNTYNGSNNGTPTPWESVGGTSLATPLWAGLTSIANQGRSLEGLSALDGRNATLPRLYGISSSVYHDITTMSNDPNGTNGAYAASAGYDLVTGRGTPIANTLVPALSGGIYTGTVYVDANGNGTYNNGEATLSGVKVFNDANNNGVLDSGETSVTSNASGVYSLDLAGTLALNLKYLAPSGYTALSNAVTGTTAYGTFTNNLAVFPTSFTASAATNYTLRLDATGTYEQIFVNTPTSSTPTYQVAKSKLTTLTFTGSSADDLFTLDLTNGSPLLSGNVSFAGAGQGSADRVNVVDNSTAVTVAYNNGSIGVGNNPAQLAYSGVEALAYTGSSGNNNVNVLSNVLPFTFAGGGGLDALNIYGGTFAPTTNLGADGTQLSLNAVGTNLTFTTNQTLNDLLVQSGGVATLAGSGLVLRTGDLTVDTDNGSALNLGNGAMILDPTNGYSYLSSVQSLLTSGYAGGAWTGAGIRSSAAAANTAYGLGFAAASDVLGLTGTNTGTFMGQTVDATAVLVRYTRLGDADLSGSVTIADFNRLAARFNTSGVSWADGDFDYDGKVTIADFNLLAANFNLSA